MFVDVMPARMHANHQSRNQKKRRNGVAVGDDDQSHTTTVNNQIRKYVCVQRPGGTVFDSFTEERSHTHTDAHRNTALKPCRLTHCHGCQ